MTTDDDSRAPHKITLGVKLVLLLSAAALVGVAWAFWVCGQSTYAHPDDYPQPRVALIVSLVLLNVFLVWLTRLDGSVQLRSLLAGFLIGLSGMICLLVTLAAFDSWGAGGVPGSVANDVLAFAPLAGGVGGLIGVVRGSIIAGATNRQPPTATSDTAGDESSNECR